MICGDLGSKISNVLPQLHDINGCDTAPCKSNFGKVRVFKHVFKNVYKEVPLWLK